MVNKSRFHPLSFIEAHETKIHICMALLWLLLAIPTVLFWSSSILWILMISIYANIGAHIAAYEGAKDDAQIAELIAEVKALKTRPCSCEH